MGGVKEYKSWKWCDLSPKQMIKRTTAVRGTAWIYSHYVNWRAYTNTFQKELSTYTDILECVLQLWIEHSLSGAYNPRSEIPDWLHVTGDHLGVLLPAILPTHRQLDWRSFHKNVSKAASLCRKGMDICIKINAPLLRHSKRLSELITLLSGEFMHFLVPLFVFFKCLLLTLRISDVW